MNVNNSYLPALMMLAALSLPESAFAAQGNGTANVISILTTTQAQTPPATGLVYGGCMANLSVNVNQLAGSPNCPTTWVTFGCDGTYATQSSAQMLLDQAQLAHIANKPVFIVVDDTMLINGMCTAVRVDVN